VLLCGAALLTGCGSGSSTTTAGLRLQREDLVAAARALAAARGEVAGEVAATKAAWPGVANGLPAQGSPQIARAAATAAALKVPAIFQERAAERLTGPGASLAGGFRQYAALSATGWRMIEYALQRRRTGGAAAGFSTANSPLYIDAVYDSHFGLAQLGKDLSAGYEKLGGPAAFGSALTSAEVKALAAAYSEERDRLHPHPGVKLGS